MRRMSGQTPKTSTVKHLSRRKALGKAPTSRRRQWRADHICPENRIGAAILDELSVEGASELAPLSRKEKSVFASSQIRLVSHIKLAPLAAVTLVNTLPSKEMRLRETVFNIRYCEYQPSNEWIARKCIYPVFDVFMTIAKRSTRLFPICSLFLEETDRDLILAVTIGTIALFQSIPINIIDGAFLGVAECKSETASLDV
jgi:hypothetical protein